MRAAQGVTMATKPLHFNAWVMDAARHIQQGPDDVPGSLRKRLFGHDRGTERLPAVRYRGVLHPSGPAINEARAEIGTTR